MAKTGRDVLSVIVHAAGVGLRSGDVVSRLEVKKLLSTHHMQVVVEAEFDIGDGVCAPLLASALQAAARIVTSSTDNSSRSSPQHIHTAGYLI